LRYNERRRTPVFEDGPTTDQRRRRGTRSGTRTLSCFKQAVLVIRWLLDAIRVRQLAVNNAIGKTTAYERLHEGIDVFVAQAPNLHGALLAAKAAGYSHVNIDGALIETDRVAARPNRDAHRRNPRRILSSVPIRHAGRTSGPSSPPRIGPVY
jgi:hypothetical protein